MSKPPQERTPADSVPPVPATHGEGPETGPVSPAAAGPAAAEPAVTPRQHVVRRTRVSALWTAVIGFAVVLILLLIFILQNLQQVRVSYFTAHGRLPLAVAMLLSAIGGALLVALPGMARMLQLRRVAHRHRHGDDRGR